MKYIIAITFLAVFFFLASRAEAVTIVQPRPADPFPVSLKKGDTGDAVKDLQFILKTDPSIYPEGTTTGFFGGLTENALRRLQRKYGLPETGVLDDATKEVIFPSKSRIDLRVIVPNGDESWDKSETHEIQWEANIGPVVVNSRTLIPQTSNQERIKPSIAPFFPYISVDLIRDSDPRFFYHIATVNLYQSSYTWKIPAEVPLGNDYRIQIGAGGNVSCLFRLEKSRSGGFSWPCPAAHPFYSAGDTSDSPFKITGSAPPPSEIITRLKNQVKQVEALLEQLGNQIRALRALVDSL